MQGIGIDRRLIPIYGNLSFYILQKTCDQNNNCEEYNYITRDNKFSLTTTVLFN